MEAGKTLSHYRLIEKIGAGGMGVVWKAKDTLLDRDVAIKVLPPNLVLDEERRRLFLDEARLAASLNHAHIVQVYELGREGALDFIVMELVEGASLSRVLQGRPVSVEKVARWGAQVAEALARAHRKNLLHLDVKPGNILVTPEDDVKLVDFGLAKLLPDAASTLSAIIAPLADAEADASHASIAGTLPYMSPEQLRGEPLDRRTDVYSLGVVLYEMSTGQRPFMGATPADLAQSIQSGRHRPVHDLVPKVPLELDRMIEKALGTRRTERYQTMDDFAVDLRHLTKQIESGSSPAYEDLQLGGTPPKPPWRRIGILTGIILLAAAAGVFAWNRFMRSERPTKAVASAKAPNWILVGEFEGVGERDGLARAAREIVVASLEQSDVVTPIPRRDLKNGLELAMKPDTTRIVGEVARELATRAGARTYVEGKVDQILSGYSVIVRLVDTESGGTLLSETVLVENQEAFMRDLDALSNRLRVRLGEKGGLVRSTRVIYPGKTPSFAAFQWWVRSKDDRDRGDYRSAIQAARRAVNIDPGFSMAWISLGVSFHGGGVRDSIAYALGEAQRNQDRLLDWQRIYLNFCQAAMVDNDPQLALKEIDLLIRLRPHDSGFHNGRGVVLNDLGRNREAIEAYSLACSLAVFGNPAALNNLIVNVLLDGDIDRATRLMKGLPEMRRPLARLQIALLKGAWAVVDSLLLEWPDVDTERAQLVEQSLRSARGEVTRASRGFEELAARNFADVSYQASLCRRLLSAIGVATRTDTLPRVVLGSNLEDQAMVALLSAMYGDQEMLRSSIATMDSLGSKKPRTDLDIQLAHAWAAIHDRRWKDVVGLQEALDSLPNPWAGALPLRWALALAHDQLGELQQAIRLYEIVLSPRHLNPSDCRIRPLLFPFAHQRLVVLYSQLGDRENARKHWDILEETVTRPDAKMAALLQEAREAMSKAGAIP